jgi:hypothetical protein
MSKTVIKFENTLNGNLFELCDEWAKEHKFKTIESIDSSRSYSKRQPIITPLSIFFRTLFKVKISLSSETISIECWIAFLQTETEVSSASMYGFLGKDMLRGHLNDLLTRLNQRDKLIH